MDLCSFDIIIIGKFGSGSDFAETMLKPCWNRAEVLLKGGRFCWNIAEIVLKRCWNIADFAEIVLKIKLWYFAVDL